MSPDRRSSTKLGPFTTWQWAVLGAYLVAIALSAIVGRTAHQAQVNTVRLDRAICAEIRYLEDVSPVARSAAQDPIQGLIKNLRKLEVSCPAKDNGKVVPK